MPTWDIIEVLKLAIRYGLVVGLFLFMAGLANLIGDTVIAIWSVINDSVDKINNISSIGNGDNASRCIFHYLRMLGLDTAVISFLVSALGLFTTWALAVTAFFIYKSGIFVKNILIGSTK